MKRLVITGLMAALLCVSATAAEISAADWAKQNLPALNEIRAAKAEAALKGGQAAFDALAAQIKTKGESDPIAATTFGAMSQFVMLHPEYRADYTARLLAQAKKATEPDVVCFFIYQLRWCGLPEQAEAIQAFETSKLEGVADLAAMTVQAVKDQYVKRPAPAKPTAAAALSAELAKLPADALTPKLISLLGTADRGCLSVVLQKGATCGDANATKLWMDAFAKQTDPERKVMVADLLGNRGDKQAAPALIAALKDPSDAVAAAAGAALLKADRAALIAHLPAWLKTLEGNRYQLVRDLVRQLPTAEAEGVLPKSFTEATETGRRIVIEFCQERRVASAVSIGLSSIESANKDIAIGGYRLLREVAGKEQAETLVAKLLTSEGRMTPEAEAAVVQSARRDASGTYRAALAKAITQAPDAQKALALDAAAKVGGAELLKAAEGQIDSANAEISGAAVRALGNWDGLDTVPALTRLAVTGKTPRIQTLALRAVTKKLSDGAVDIAPFFPVWNEVKGLPGNEENKKALSPLFNRPVNVALHKKVTRTNVPHEGNNVPAHLTDGSVAKAWYGHGSPAVAEIDLEAVYTLSGAHVTFYHADKRTYTFNLEVSEDGKSWKKMGGNEDAPKPATAEGIRFGFDAVKARYVRLNVIKNSANPAVHVLELEVFTKAE